MTLQFAVKYLENPNEKVRENSKKILVEMYKKVGD
jgi:hypothetical protein